VVAGLSRLDGAGADGNQRHLRTEEPGGRTDGGPDAAVAPAVNAGVTNA
jgi:hypothetical protein